jgi:beta-lactamase superfamily II metal-dependent hydrolase
MFYTLHAAPSRDCHDIDNNGLVLKLSFNKISFLFTADIYHEAEWYLISKGIALKSTVLKIAHHGAAHLPPMSS